MNNKRSLYKCSKNKYKRQEFRSPVIITHRTYSASRPTAHKSVSTLYTLMTPYCLQANMRLKLT